MPAARDMPDTTTDSRLAEYYRCRAEYIEDGFPETIAETLAWQMANFDLILKYRDAAGYEGGEARGVDTTARERAE